LVIIGISGFYVGTISDRYAEINGLIIAIFTSTIVLLYIAQYTEMNWAVNRIFIASYLVIGFLSSLISRITNKKQKVKKKNKKEENVLKFEDDTNSVGENINKNRTTRIHFSFSDEGPKVDNKKFVEEFMLDREDEIKY
jgi:hypothetical protein